MHLSTTGWIFLIIFLIFIISVNLSLVFAFRKKPAKNDWTEKIKKASRSIADPWSEEDRQFGELSKQVEQLSGNRKNSNE